MYSFYTLAMQLIRGLAFLLEITDHSQLCVIDASYYQTGYSANHLDVLKDTISVSTTLKALDFSYNNFEELKAFLGY